LERLWVPRVVGRELELALVVALALVLALVLALLWVQPIPSWVSQPRGRKHIPQQFLHLIPAKTQEQLLQLVLPLPHRLPRLSPARCLGQLLQRRLALPQRILSVHQAKRQKQRPHLAGLPLTPTGLWRLVQCDYEP